MQVLSLYKKLYQIYGPQGWWPLYSYSGDGYHPQDYFIPRLKSRKFEIALGAILTQNTSWGQVWKVIKQLYIKKLLDPLEIINIKSLMLEEIIRPTGYYKQKTKKIKIFAQYFIDQKKAPSRDDLLKIWGIGEETADCILLYAYGIPSFVIDAYTRRILGHYQLINEKLKYSKIKNFIESSLPCDYKIYQEFHALLVAHGKNYYTKKPYGKDDLLFGR